ncbi:MAG: putative membrane protein [Candidatus Azotimanducaceae bacterium]|jgi:uncharacterized membrane protein
MSVRNPILGKRFAKEIFLANRHLLRFSSSYSVTTLVLLNVKCRAILLKTIEELVLIYYLKIAGLVFIFLWFFVGGVGHFINTPFFLAIVPPWVPFPLAAVYASGVVEISLSVLLIVSKIRVWVGWGIIALTVAVTPANLHMWMNPELFPEVSPTLLSFRLLIQVGLIALIWWCTRDDNLKES